MDNKLIQRYGEEILCYRIRTARQKKRRKVKGLEKELIGLHKERKTLFMQRRNLGWEPLQPPIQRGWKRFFVLRDDVARSKYADFFQRILDKINTKDWSYRKNFLIKRRRFGKKRYVIKGQKLFAPREHEFLKLDFSEIEKQFFRVEYYSEKSQSQPVKRYMFKEPWRFQLRVRPNMIDKIQRMDAKLEARLKEIDNYVERKDYEGKQAKLVYGHHRGWLRKGFEKHKEVNLFKGKTLREILDLLKNDK